MWVAAVKLSTAPYANAMNQTHPILVLNIDYILFSSSSN